MDARVTVKQNSDFRRIYRRGRSAVSGGVVVYCLKNRQGMSRLGVTVSTKLGHAVVRNRVRRRFRELYRLHRADMLPGWDIIMVGRVRAAELPYQSWKSNTSAALQSWDCCGRTYEKVPSLRHPLLSPGRLAPVPAPLPLYPHLLAVRP